tara:strand:- start:831 stop:1553 length:723 start_codon:yes stop_codon:yes gene_type:complete
MKVQDVMNREPHAVRIVDRLDEVARIMWEQDCGFVPVVDGANAVVGVVTDRDLCMASYMQGVPIASIPVVAVMVQDPTTCGPEATMATAMAAMAAGQVHRLPVVDSQGVLMGVLSSNDVIQAAKARPTKISASDALATMAAITSPRSGVREFADAKRAPAKKASAAKTATAKAAATKAPAKQAAAKSVEKTAVLKPARKPAAKPAATARKAAAKAKAKAPAKPTKASSSRGGKGRGKAKA